ncbi:type II toxin-antitoxin system ParD family antitoxin [Cyclobacterium plantarum]|uniref:type II toxin-antitoxin system ParD family antitoxin n=1 Tax=Cyclobacterium plantarum TaxID=2716263 RepID=UPI003F7192CE
MDIEFMAIMGQKFDLSLSQVGFLFFLEKENRFPCKIDKIEKSELYARKLINKDERPCQQWIDEADKVRKKYQNICLGKYYDSFIKTCLREGRFNDASEVIRVSLRLLEEYEFKIAALTAEVGKARTNSIT